MKKHTNSSKAYSKRNISDRVHSSFPQEGQEQASIQGSQSNTPPQQPGYEMNSPMGPSQDLSFGQTN